MKFWLTIILGTVALSFGSTWLVMHQGAQEQVKYSYEPATGEPGEIEFGGPGKQVSNIRTIDVGRVMLGKPQSVEIPFRNTGKGPLTVELIRVSCGCAHDVKIDGDKVEPGHKPVVKAPGQSGTISVAWNTKIDIVAAGGPDFVLSLDLLVNDPQYYEPVRIEIKSRLTPPTEGKP
jgi:hypothetical protein